MTPISLLIADSQPVVRQGLRAMLAAAADIQILAAVENLDAAADVFQEHSPDVVLLDLCENRRDTEEAVNALRRRFPESRFLIFTHFEGRDEVLMALKSNMSGYLLKTAAPEEIIAAIRAVHRGERWLSPELSRKLGDAAIDPELTERERDVLAAVASGKSNREIADALFIAEGTVKFHLKNILAKLGATDRTEAVVIGLSRGLLRLSENEPETRR